MAKKSEKDLFVAKSIKSLEISKEEALELWSFDHEDNDNEEVDKIEKKIESEKPKPPSKIGNVLTMKAKKKIDIEKDLIVDAIHEAINAEPSLKFPQFMSANKITFISDSDTYYTVSITKHKRKPDGYKGEKNVEEN